MVLGINLEAESITYNDLVIPEKTSYAVICENAGSAQPVSHSANDIGVKGKILS